MVTQLIPQPEETPNYEAHLPTVSGCRFSCFNVQLRTLVNRFTIGRSPDSVSVHLTLGNPSDATEATSNKHNFLMVKPQYALSFNNAKGGPNWVSWHLVASDIGEEERGDFTVHQDLPNGFKKIRKADYNNNGFDRGHVCNSKDQTDTRENKDATFLMTNILLQAPDNNQGPWVRLENFERELAQGGK